MLVEAVRLNNVYKYRNKCILNNVSFAVWSGEIVGLVGNHSEGISTLISILSGREFADSGSMVIGGEKISLSNRYDGTKTGIFRVDQAGMLVERMSVAENLCLIKPALTKHFPLNTGMLERKAEEILSQFGLQLDVQKRASQLTPFERDLVKVIKMSLHTPKLLILDNITLHYNAVQRLEMKRVLELIASRGTAVMIVSTEPVSVMAMAQRIIIFTDGRVQGIFEEKEYDEDTIRALMSPHVKTYKIKQTSRLQPKEILRFENLSAEGRRYPDICISEGEAVGFVRENGEIDKTIIYLLRGSLGYSGTVYLSGMPIKLDNEKTSIHQHIAYLTAYDSPAMLQENMTLADNFLLGNPVLRSKFGFVSHRLQRFACREAFKDSQITRGMLQRRPGDLSSHLRNEYNMMKLQAIRPKVLLLDDPFMRADAHMKNMIYETLQKLLDNGVCIIMGINAEEEQSEIASKVVYIS